jgi:hypothetical protein
VFIIRKTKKNSTDEARVVDAASQGKETEEKYEYCGAG